MNFGAFSLSADSVFACLPNVRPLYPILSAVCTYRRLLSNSAPCVRFIGRTVCQIITDAFVLPHAVVGEVVLVSVIETNRVIFRLIRQCLLAH